MVRAVASEVDNIDLYGHWVPIIGESYDDFLRQFELGEDVPVALGRPDDEGNNTVNSTPTNTEIKLRPK